MREDTEPATVVTAPDHGMCSGQNHGQGQVKDPGLSPHPRMQRGLTPTSSQSAANFRRKKPPGLLFTFTKVLLVGRLGVVVSNMYLLTFSTLTGRGPLTRASVTG